MTALLRCAAGAIGAIGLLGGCTSDNGNSEARSSTTEIDVDAAREQYLAMVEQPNEIFAEFRSLSTDEARVTMLPQVADILEELGHDLTGAEWPTDVQDEIDEAVTAVLTLRTAAVQLIDEPTVDAILARFAEATTDFGAAGAAVRLALNLPLNDE